MKSLGISIGESRLAAVMWDQSLLSSRMEGSWYVPCGEPFGGPAEIARLAEEVRRAAGPGPLPPAVISLPPSWTFLRRVSLPVADLPRAKKMHVAELEGNLPLDDEEILSDLLPSPAGEPGTFLAIAARRSAVEKTVAAFAAAGFRVDRAITDHVALLCAALSSRNGFSGAVLSGLNDLVALRIVGGAVASARQFPAELAETPGEIDAELEEFLGGNGQGSSSPVIAVGDLPPSVGDRIQSLSPFAPPGGLGDASPVALGAALAPFFGKETGGFSLRTSAEAESERGRRESRVRIAAVAAAVAVLAAVGSLQVARWAGEKKVARIRAEIRKEFTEAVPGVKVVVQETAQLREKIQSLSRQRKELGTDFPEPTSMLSKVSRALPVGGSITVREVTFDSGRLRIAGDAASAQNLETFRTSLVEAFGTDSNVTVQGAEGSARGGSVRFTILVEKGANGRAA